jgi:LuxR family transcriptional regulator, activator of tox operons
MQVHDLHSTRRNNAHIRALTEIIREVGRPSFAGNLFAFAHEMIGADHVTAFCMAGPGLIRTVLAENSGSRPIARAVAERYVRHHWTCDPVQKMLSDQKASVSGTNRCFVVGMDAADVEHSDYRNECYSSVNLDHRLSIAHARGGATMRVNFYRRLGRDFSQDEIGRITDVADLVLAAVWRHDEQDRVPTDEAGLQELFLQRLAGLSPALTERERQVCALSAIGLTSEGIALRLNIGVNTVLTYRKRAYRRLSISSQNELMHRLML